MLNILCLAWLDGPYQSTDFAFGLPIFWWSRIAKIIQFISGLIIVVDIIGAEKVKLFGAKLRNSISLRSIWSTMIVSFKLTLNHYRILFRVTKPSVVEDKKKQNIIFIQWIWLQILAFGLPITAYKIFQAGYFKNLTPSDAIPFVILFCIIIILHGILFTLLQIIINLIIALFDIIFIEPIALFVQLNGVEARAKKVSLFLFLVGFSVDLLTS